MRIQDEMLLGCLSLSANQISGAHLTVEYAAEVIQHWADTPQTKTEREKYKKVVALLDEIRGKYRTYFRIGLYANTVQQALNEISLAILNARDILLSDEPFATYFGGSRVLAPLRETKGDCDEIQTAVANSFVSLACLQIADAMHTAGVAEDGLIFYERRAVDSETQARLNEIRAGAWAAFDTVREKYQLYFDTKKNGDELEDAKEETR